MRWKIDFLARWQTEKWFERIKGYLGSRWLHPKHQDVYGCNWTVIAGKIAFVDIVPAVSILEKIHNNM